MVPAALLASVFPALVRARDDDPARARQLRSRTLLALLPVAAIVAAGGAIFGDAIVNVLYGTQYPGAGTPLRLLALGTLLTFTNYALTHFLVSADRQRTLLAINAGVFLTNLALCLLLVPARGPTGAALAILASESLLLGACFVAVRRAPNLRAGRPFPATGSAS
jgi:PST family polysaccharide transporter